jgi:hypothetical protein
MISALVLSMLTVSLGGLPRNEKGLAEKINLIQTVNAAEVEQVEQVTNPLFERISEWFTALAAGGPEDVQAVNNLRDELAGLDVVANRELIEPIWNKISPNIPAYVDQVELKASLFRLIKAIGSLHSMSDIEAFRSDPEFQATLKMIAVASGNENFNMDDLLVFLFGDGGSNIGIEGTVSTILGNMSLIQLTQLISNSQDTTGVLLQAIEKQLGDTNAYKVSSILADLDISFEDIRTIVLSLQNKLETEGPAINAMSLAYIRSATKATAQVSEDGRQHRYSLNLLGVDVPAFALIWSKVNGDEHVTVMPDGVVTIPEGVQSGSAIIQAKLVNPYGGSAKVIFEQEVTLTDVSVVEENVFPVEEFMKRLDKIRVALIAGGSSDVEDVRNLHDEIIGLDFNKNQALIDPIWNPIANNLPTSVDEAELKKQLLNIFQAVGSLRYDVEASQLEVIRANPEYRATLKTIATAAGVPTLTIDDILIMLFGDGAEQIGVEGTVRNNLAAMSSKELAKLFSDKNGLATVKSVALATVLNDKTGYAISDALYNLGVRPNDIDSMLHDYKGILKFDEPAIKSLSAAYIRSETESTLKVTEDGRQHVYGLTVLGVELPTSSVKWKKISGSKDVKVDSKGKVSISKKVQTGTAVIQASLVNFFGGSSKVIFEQEVTLINGESNPEAEVKKIIETLESTLAEIRVRHNAATTDSEKVQLILEVVQAGNDSFDQINNLDASKGIKTKAINNVKKQVNQLNDLIIQSVMKF